MNLKHGGDSEARFAGYVEGLSSVIGHADRAGPLRDYCAGLMFRPLHFRILAVGTFVVCLHRKVRRMG
jgi:SRSO17 transposase